MGHLIPAGIGHDGQTARSLTASHTASHTATGRLDPNESTLIAHTLRGEGYDASEDGTGRGVPLVPIAFSAKDHGGDAVTDLSPTLRAGAHSNSHANAGVMPAIAFSITPSNSNKDYNDRATERAQALTGGGNRPSARGGDLIAFDTAQITSRANRTRAEPGLPVSTLSSVSRMHVASSAVRRLTPTECERLQGFPDGFTLIPWRKGFASDGPRYKALGNSMAVPVMRWLGERIALVDGI